MQAQPTPAVKAEDQPFQLVSVTPTEPPAGGTGKNWCEYIIVQGKNRIVGYSRGSLRRVKKETREKVEELNRRRGGSKARPKK